MIDLLPTCLEVAAAPYPKTHGGREVLPVEGRSLLPLFAAKQRKSHDALFWEHEGHRAVRQGKWKLVAVHRGPWELYDLQNDRTEQKDLATAHPEKVRELTALYDAWSRRCGVIPWAELQRTTASHKSR